MLNQCQRYTLTASAVCLTEGHTDHVTWLPITTARQASKKANIVKGFTQSSPDGGCHRVSDSRAANDLGVTWGFGVEEKRY